MHGGWKTFLGRFIRADNSRIKEEYKKSRRMKEGVNIAKKKNIYRKDY